MSTFVRRPVPCSGCARQWPVELPTSINATRTPQWRTAILDGSFGRVWCPACGLEQRPLIPFAYLDFQRRQLVTVFPESDETEWLALEGLSAQTYRRNLGEEAPDVAQAIGEGFAVRTTFGVEPLAEKLVVWDAGLDDAWVEVLKLRLMVAATERVVDPATRPRVVAASPVVLEVRWPDGASVTVSRGDYDRLRSEPAAVTETASPGRRWPVLRCRPNADRSWGGGGPAPPVIIAGTHPTNWT